MRLEIGEEGIPDQGWELEDGAIKSKRETGGQAAGGLIVGRSFQGMKQLNPWPAQSDKDGRIGPIADKKLPGSSLGVGGDRPKRRHRSAWERGTSGLPSSPHQMRQAAFLSFFHGGEDKPALEPARLIGDNERLRLVGFNEF